MKTRSRIAFTSILAALLPALHSPAQAPEGAPFPVLEPGGHAGRIAEVLIIPGGSRIITLGGEGSIRFLDPENGRTDKVWVLGNEAPEEIAIRAGCLSPDGTLLAVGGNIGPNKKEIWLMETATQRIVHKLPGHNNGVRALKFSKDGQTLISGGRSQALQLWRVADGGLLQSLDAGGEIYRLDVSPQGAIIAVTYDKRLLLWTPKGKTYQFKEVFRSPEYILSAAFAPDGNSFVSAGEDGKICLWDKNGHLIRTLYEAKTSGFLSRMDARGSVSSLSFSPSGRFLAFGESNFTMEGFKPKHVASARTIDMATGQVAGQVEHDNTLLHTVFLNDGQVASASGGSNQVILWEVSAGNIRQGWQSRGRLISALGVNGELDCAFGNQGLINQTAPLERAFDFGRLAFKGQGTDFKEYARTVMEFAGRRLTAQNEYTLQVTGGRTITVDPFTEGRIQDFTFTPSGNIALACDYSLELWDTQGQLLRVFTGFAGELRTLGVSASGRYIFAGGSDQSARMWNLESGALLASLFVHENSEWVCWASNGYYEASPGGHELLKWYQKQGEGHLPALIAPEEARKRFHQPALLRQMILSGAVDTTVPAPGEKLPPLILANLRDSQVVSNRNLSLSVNIESSAPITSATIELNGSPIPLPAGLSLPASRLHLKETLRLRPEMNTLRIRAGNEHGGATLREWAILYRARPDMVLSTGHSKTITKMAFSRDGKHLASASLDKTIRIWDVNTGKLFQTIRGEQIGQYTMAGLETVDINPASHREVATAAGHVILIFDAAAGKLLQEIADPEIRGMAFIRQVLFHPAGRMILSGASDGRIKIWDIENGRLLRRLSPHGGEVTEMAFGPQGSYLISMGTDNQLIIQDLESGRLLRRLQLTNHVTDEDMIGIDDFLELNSDGTMMLTGGIHSNQVLLWPFPEGELLATITVNPDNRLSGAVFLPGEQGIALSSSDQPIQLYNYQAELRETWPDASRNARCLAISPDGKNLMSAHGLQQGIIRSWPVSAGMLDQEMGSGISPLTAVNLSSSGQWLAAGGADGFVKLWGLAEGRAVYNLNAAEDCMLLAGIFDVGFSPGDSLVAAASCDHSIRLWDVRTGQQKLRLEGHQEAVRALAFSPDGRRLFSGGSDGKIGVWELPSGKLIRWLDGGQGPVGRIEASPDGRVLASADYRRLLLWDWRSGEALQEYEMQITSLRKLLLGESAENDAAPSAKMEELAFLFYYYDLAFSPDGQSIFICGSADGEIARIDLESGAREIFRAGAVPVEQYVALAVGSAGRYLAAAGLNSRRIDLHYLPSGQAYMSLEGHQEAITSLAFTPDGRFLVSASRDGSIIYWNLENGEAAFTLIANPEGAYAIRAADNYFLSSKAKMQELAFRLEDELFLFEQFDLLLNRPDIILERLGFASPQKVAAYRNAYLKRLEKMGFREENLKFSLTDIPQVRLLEEPPTHSQSPTLEISLEASSAGQPLDRLNVFVNDVPIYGLDGLSLRDKSRPLYQTRLQLELSGGRNKIQLSTLNQAGAESLKETFYITYDGPQRKPNLHLIALGAGEFADPAMNLAYPAKDAADVANFFSKDTAIYGEVIIEDHYNQAITPTLHRQLKDKLMQTHVDDCVILYLAGHGLVDKNLDYYLATYDMDFNRPAEKGIPYDELEALLDGIPARQKLFLLDACHSGEIDKESVALIREQRTEDGEVRFRAFDTRIVPTRLGLDNSFELMKQLFVDLRRGTGATVISSAGGVEFALEGDKWQNGVFAYCLLKGLKQGAADADKDGHVMVSELQRYLAAEVPRLTGGQQRPTFRVENISNDWRVW